jgi:hypothetical protein
MKVIKFENITVVRNHEFSSSQSIKVDDQFFLYENCTFIGLFIVCDPKSTFKGCNFYNCTFIIDEEKTHIPENLKGYLSLRGIERDIQDHVIFSKCSFEKTATIKTSIPLSRATFGLKGLEPIGTYKKIANKIKKNNLNMNQWHVCDTCHCIAGWAQHIFDHGDIMQQLYGTCVAGTMIAPRVAHYFFEYGISKKEAISALNEAEESLMKDYEQITNNE